ncbi:hypothetical protein NIES4073_52120 [Kalymmatonema gypsitolerans NIES-4073]|nr:hypothetical protein NIES4073_52120 [Scytonema sp. NIES-4073]
MVGDAHPALSTRTNELVRDNLVGSVTAQGVVTATQLGNAMRLLGGGWYGSQCPAVGNLDSRSPHQPLRFAAQSSPVPKSLI